MSEQGPAAAGADLSALVYGRGLGAHRATYRPYRRPPWSEQPASAKAPALIAGGFALLIVVVLAVQAPVFAVFVVVAVAVIAAIRVPRNRRAEARMVGRELRFYEHGLINIGVGQAGPAVIRWDEASVLQDVTRHLRNGSHTHTTYLYKLSSPDGTQTAVSGIIGGVGGMERPEEWGNAIQSAVTSAQLPRAAAALGRGETVAFGDITVGRDGISAQGKYVGWDQLQEIRVKDGYVSLKVAGRWRSLSTTAVSSIPNYFVFHALAERMHAGHRAAKVSRPGAA
jgi:hypothetical protein